MAFFYMSGAFNKLNRHLKYNNENERLQSERTLRIENSVQQLAAETREIKKHLMEYNFHLRMDTVDMSEYFPLRSDEQLQRFLQQDDEWNQRKKESYICLPTGPFTIFEP